MATSERPSPWRRCRGGRWRTAGPFPLLSLVIGAPAGAQPPDPRQTRLETDVRHELMMLPYYNVFDNLEFKLGPKGQVTLLGQVVRPTLKTDAERVVTRIQGVEQVINEIETLPVSPNDDPGGMRVGQGVGNRHTHGDRLIQRQPAADARAQWPPVHVLHDDDAAAFDGRDVVDWWRRVVRTSLVRTSDYTNRAGGGGHQAPVAVPRATSVAKRSSCRIASNSGSIRARTSVNAGRSRAARSRQTSAASTSPSSACAAAA